MKKQLDYRILLTIWLALGISFTGYFYINPTKRTYTNYSELDEILGLEPSYSTSVSYKNSQTSGLVTIVGGLLIGGIGYIKSNKE